MSDAGSRPIPSDRRSEARQAAGDALKLVFPGGQVVAASAVDRSLRGLRVRSVEADSLPRRLTVLSPGTGAAYQAEVVWRRAPFAGLLLTRTVDMRTAAGADTDELRRLWREHVGR